jgi:hypothetical protein
MQVLLLKAEESEAFYREKMYLKEKEIDSFKNKVKSLEHK